jgi:hypothetical protein
LRSSRLSKRHLVRLLLIGRHEGGPTRPVFVGVKAEEILVPLLRTLGVAHVDVDVLEIHRSLGHAVLAGHSIGSANRP